jgi:hypothetical protein
MPRLRTRTRSYSRGLLIFERNHVEDPVLTVLEEDEVTRTNGGRDVGDSEVVAVHVVHANRYSDHAGIVPPGHAPYLVAKTPPSWRACVLERVLDGASRAPELPRRRITSHHLDHTSDAATVDLAALDEWLRVLCAV